MDGMQSDFRFLLRQRSERRKRVVCPADCLGCLNSADCKFRIPGVGTVFTQRLPRRSPRATKNNNYYFELPYGRDDTGLSRKLLQAFEKRQLTGRVRTAGRIMVLRWFLKHSPTEEGTYPVTTFKYDGCLNFSRSPLMELS